MYIYSLNVGNCHVRGSVEVNMEAYMHQHPGAYMVVILVIHSLLLTFSLLVHLSCLICAHFTTLFHHLFFVAPSPTPEVYNQREIT